MRAWNYRFVPLICLAASVQQQLQL